MNDKHLSKQISYALRHAPWKFELELDGEGWVEIDKLLFSLNETNKWGDVSLSDIERVIENSDKKRIELKEGKIRAIILTIKANKAWCDGRCFYQGNDKVWLADIIEPDYIIF